MVVQCRRLGLDAVNVESEVEGLLKRWSSVVLAHESYEVPSLVKLAGSLRTFMRAKCIQLIRDARDRPVLLSYSGDGTPIRTKVRSAVGSQGVVCSRFGYNTQEYYIQNEFCLYFDCGDVPNIAVILGDPAPMTSGKTAPATAGFGVAFMLNPRHYGHEGPVVRHQAFDRCCYSAITRIYR